MFYREEFVKQALELLTDNNTKWKEWSEKGFKNTERFAWSVTAQEWVEMFRQECGG